MENTQKEVSKWSLAHDYADAKYHMEKGDHISKYEKYEEIKEAFEKGFEAAMKLKDTDVKY